MTFHERLRQLRRLVAAWLCARLTGHTAPDPPVPDTLFDFSAAEEADALPPPPPSPPAALPPPGAYTALQPIYVVMPRNLTLDKLTDLLALSLVDPPTAEGIRWALLEVLNIPRAPTQSPIDAWLRYTRSVNRFPDITLALLHAQPLSARARAWILFLVGVDTDADASAAQRGDHDHSPTP